MALSESQRAMVAARVRPHFEKLAKERQRVHGDTAPGRVKNTHGQLATSVKVLKSLASEEAGMALSESQRAMVAARVREHYVEAAKERQRAGGSVGGQAAHGKVRANWPTPPERELKSRASEEAGAALNVSRQSVDRARVVQEKGVPELAKKVEAGES